MIKHIVVQHEIQLNILQVFANTINKHVFIHNSHKPSPNKEGKSHVFLFASFPVSNIGIRNLYRPMYGHMSVQESNNVMHLYFQCH